MTPRDVLFLDVDGVLNDCETACVFINKREVRPALTPSCVKQFNRLFASYGRAKATVFSTSWRDKLPPETLFQYLCDNDVNLPPLHAAPVTPRAPRRPRQGRWSAALTPEEQRGAEIGQWMIMHRPASWICFDDMDLRNALLRNPGEGVFVLCTPTPPYLNTPRGGG